MDTKRPKSMAEFDYFQDRAQAAPEGEVSKLDDLPSGLEEQVASYHRGERRYRRFLLLSMATTLVCVWFLWSFEDWIRYSFAAPSSPRQLGEVTSLTPDTVPHNTYVELQGVTEHRGLRQKVTRGLSLSRQELWYFRLLGSRGVFIEVEPDGERFGFTTKVKVAGRAVDPAKASVYSGLLRTYEDSFFPRGRTSLRIIQVGVKPGEGRTPFLLAFGFVAILTGANVWAIVAWMRLRRRRPDQSRLS